MQSGDVMASRPPAAPVPAKSGDSNPGSSRPSNTAPSSSSGGQRAASSDAKSGKTAPGNASANATGARQGQPVAMPARHRRNTAANRQRPVNLAAPGAAASKLSKHCNCKNSRCLKLYCECFASGRYCDHCNCVNCCNNLENEATRQSAVEAILERNPNAFRPKIQGSTSIAGVDAGQDPVNPSARHNKGCNCKKSGCLKKYCECFQANILCSDICKCVDCKNFEGSDARASASALIHRDVHAAAVQQQQARQAASAQAQLAQAGSPPPSKRARMQGQQPGAASRIPRLPNSSGVSSSALQLAAGIQPTRAAIMRDSIGEMVKRGGLHEMGQLLLLIARERGEEAATAAAVEMAAASAAIQLATAPETVTSAADPVIPANEIKPDPAASTQLPASAKQLPAAGVPPPGGTLAAPVGTSVGPGSNPPPAAAVPTQAPAAAGYQQQLGAAAGGSYGQVAGTGPPPAGQYASSVGVSAPPGTPPRRPAGYPNGTLSPQLGSPDRPLAAQEVAQEGAVLHEFSLFMRKLLASVERKAKSMTPAPLTHPQQSAQHLAAASRQLQPQRSGTVSRQGSGAGQPPRAPQRAGGMAAAGNAHPGVAASQLNAAVVAAQRAGQTPAQAIAEVLRSTSMPATGIPGPASGSIAQYQQQSAASSASAGVRPAVPGNMVQGMRPPSIPSSTIPTWVTQQPMYQQNMYGGHYPQHSVQQQQQQQHAAARPLAMPPTGIKPYPNATAPVLINPNYGAGMQPRPMSQPVMSQQQLARPAMSQQQMSHPMMVAGQQMGSHQQLHGVAAYGAQGQPSQRIVTNQLSGQAMNQQVSQQASHPGVPQHMTGQAMSSYPQNMVPQSMGQPQQHMQYQPIIQQQQIQQHQPQQQQQVVAGQRYTGQYQITASMPGGYDTGNIGLPQQQLLHGQPWIPISSGMVTLTHAPTSAAQQHAMTGQSPTIPSHMIPVRPPTQPGHPAPATMPVMVPQPASNAAGKA